MRPMKPDPAPSRLAWRIERLMLTPGVRFVMRTGLPMAALGLAGYWYFSQPEVQARLTDTVSEIRASIEQRPEFMVNLMAIDGAGSELAETIRTAVHVDFPISSFDLDLDALRADITALDPIENVAVRIRSGGILQVDVTPRVPVVVWRSETGLRLLDAEGQAVGPLTWRADRADLPLIAGEGAEKAVQEARALFRAAAPLKDRLRGLQRVGLRRWDVVLDKGQRILLPARDPVPALERMIALDGASEILTRDITRIDLRLRARPTIQMQARATDERWRIRDLNMQSGVRR